MATTVGAETLVVEISERINLAGVNHSYSKRLLLTSINEFMRRVVSTTTSLATYLTLAQSAGAGAFVAADLRYLRITNLDSTNFVTVGLVKTGADTVYHKLEAGQSLVLFNDSIDAYANGSAFATFAEWDTLTLQADTAGVDVELVVASA